MPYLPVLVPTGGQNDQQQWTHGLLRERGHTHFSYNLAAWPTPSTNVSGQTGKAPWKDAPGDMKAMTQTQQGTLTVPKGLKGQETG